MKLSATESHEPNALYQKPMTVEEARQVRWLRQNPRPLGELLDSGYLNAGRLEWAAKNAFDPKLKAAAQVLLANRRTHYPTPAPVQPPPAAPSSLATTAVPISISIEQANATVWPFGPLKGQAMGPLVDTRQLTIKDLAYAVENAWNLSVRQAAIALLLKRLDQVVQEPIPTAGPLRVVSSGRSFAERQQLLLAMLQGLLAGSFLVLLIVYLVRSLPRMWSPDALATVSRLLSNPSGIIAFAIVICIMFATTWLFLYLVNKASTGFDQKMYRYYQGQQGETRVVEVMGQALDGTWTLFRNVALPGQNRADIDLVLVGPSHVIAIEVKCLSGHYRNIGDRWDYRAGSRWIKAKANPSRQAQKNAQRLSSFLRADHISQWVDPIVIWAASENAPDVENPKVAVWSLDRLTDELGNIPNAKALPDGTRQQIIAKLTKLCEDSARKSYLAAD